MALALIQFSVSLAWMFYAYSIWGEGILWYALGGVGIAAGNAIVKLIIRQESNT